MTKIGRSSRVLDLIHGPLNLKMRDRKSDTWCVEDVTEESFVVPDFGDGIGGASKMSKLNMQYSYTLVLVLCTLIIRIILPTSV